MHPEVRGRGAVEEAGWMLTEVVVELEDRIGALADLGELLGGEGVNISALAVVRPTWPCGSCASTTWPRSGSGRCCR